MVVIPKIPKPVIDIGAKLLMAAATGAAARIGALYVNGVAENIREKKEEKKKQQERREKARKILNQWKREAVAQAEAILRGD